MSTQDTPLLQHQGGPALGGEGGGVESFSIPPRGIVAELRREVLPL